MPTYRRCRVLKSEFDQSVLARKTDQGPDGARPDVGGSADDNSTRNNDTLPSRDPSESILFTLVNALVPRPHLQFEAQLVARKSHDFGPISCPELPNTPLALSGIAFGKQKHDAELKYPQRSRRLSIFPASKTEV